MSIIFGWALPALILLIVGGWFTWQKAKEDILYYDCLTRGTLARIPMVLIGAATPIINWMSLIVIGAWALAEYDRQIKDFFREPVCGRKK
ncbi:hypothetical protein [Xanthomonas phage BUDD]|nr:hypothetical protein [Xanthomonas phage BUDD]